MQEQLENKLKEDGFLTYNMSAIYHESFWEFWRTHNKPPVRIEEIDLELSKWVPCDAVVTVGGLDIDREVLCSLEHVVDLSCCAICDRDVAGYTGHAKIDAIVLTRLSHDSPLPKCNHYRISLEHIDTHVFDCGGAAIDTLCISLRPGFYANIAKYFINYTEIIIQASYLHQLCEEAPEIAANPNITVNMIAFTDFNSDIFAGKFIANLALHSYGKIVVTHDPNTDIRITNIVEFDECFKEFVLSISMRFKRTKRCIS